MLNYSEEFKKWLENELLPEDLREELLSVKDDENEKKERFYCRLSFGTAGLRGIIRAGTNGMNVLTVAQATQGLANLIIKEKRQSDGVVIASDTRIKSDEFSRISACVLAANGIPAYIFDAPRPTPELSFAIRELGTAAGINITASHNPKEYNGYKAYWDDGAQLPPDHAKIVYDEIVNTDIFTGVKKIDFDDGVKSGMIKIVGKELDEKYLEKVLDERISKDAIPKVADDFKVVYTPFHGAGRILVPEVLKRAGLKNLYCVEEQMTPDGSFPTVKKPNPEYKEEFALAMKLASELDSDLIIGTDPDADRTGVVVKTKDGNFVCLTGNQIGCLLLAYIIECRKRENRLPENSCVVKSIVSTRLADKICEDNGVKAVNVLTGFKFIGEKIKEYEKTHEHTYIFGFEESFGYLSGTYARDKDAVCASLLVCELASYYKTKNMNLCEALEEIYEKYGYFREKNDEFVFEGADGSATMKRLMDNVRANMPKNIAGEKITFMADYLSGYEIENGVKKPASLPKSDVLMFNLSDGSCVAVRPSGTEPKVKAYYMVKGNDHADTQQKLEKYREAFGKLLSE